jgi:hypothetical protein
MVTTHTLRCSNQARKLLRKERDALAERVKRLEEAGDRLEKAAGRFPLPEIENSSDVGDEYIQMRDVPVNATIWYEDGPTAGEHVALLDAIQEWRKVSEKPEGGAA